MVVRHYRNSLFDQNTMSDIRCFGIATGGGDAPGLNAVIRAATKAAILEDKRKSHWNS
jgi:hypothetical protein